MQLETLDVAIRGPSHIPVPYLNLQLVIPNPGVPWRC